MALIRKSALKEMSADDMDKKLKELRFELVKERGKIKVGGTPENSGRLQETRKLIARILTMKTARVLEKKREAEQKKEKTRKETAKVKSQKK